MSDEALFAALRKGGRLSAEDRLLVSSFIQDRQAQSRDAWRSHPLGFFVIKKDITPQRALRLHVWPERWAVAEGQEMADIHDHIFDLFSFVALGEVTNETFDVVDDPEGQHRILPIQYVGDSSGGTQVEARLLRLTLRTSESHEAGDVYRVPAGTIHRGGLKRGPAVTVLATERVPSITSPRVIMGRGVPAPPSFDRKSPDGETWMNITSIARQAADGLL
ncbi:MAG: hypothetical protein K0Q69_1271 [Devosia sp.]|jgi:hypothetical protein|nr:hypothetical protein [Devosia sp.]